MEKDCCRAYETRLFRIQLKLVRLQRKSIKEIMATEDKSRPEGGSGRYVHIQGQ